MHICTCAEERKLFACRYIDREICNTDTRAFRSDEYDGQGLPAPEINRKLILNCPIIFPNPDQIMITLQNVHFTLNDSF